MGEGFRVRALKTNLFHVAVKITIIKIRYIMTATAPRQITVKTSIRKLIEFAAGKFIIARTANQ